jgi:hypothetical protein
MRSLWTELRINRQQSLLPTPEEDFTPLATRPALSIILNVRKYEINSFSDKSCNFAFIFHHYKIIRSKLIQCQAVKPGREGFKAYGK